MGDLLKRALDAHHERLTLHAQQAEEMRLFRMESDRQLLDSHLTRLGIDAAADGGTLEWVGHNNTTPAVAFDDDTWRLQLGSSGSPVALLMKCPTCHIWKLRGYVATLADIGQTIEHFATYPCSHHNAE